MPHGIPNKHDAAEFKQEGIETMQRLSAGAPGAGKCGRMYLRLRNQRIAQGRYIDAVDERMVENVGRI